MSQCKRSCVVAFSGPERFTYLFGDLDPARDAEAILDGIVLYAANSDGFMAREERPIALRASVLGRIPPIGSSSELVLRERRK